MFFELFLCLRYLKARRKQAFISVISIISIIGVMVGVMALIVVLSVMNGFRADLMSKILGVRAHIVVSNFGGPFTDYHKMIDDIKNIDDVTGVTPAIYSQVMIKSSGSARAPYLRGIETGSTKEVIDIGSMLKGGSLSSLDERFEGIPSIIVGSELADQINVRPGSVISLVSPEGRLTPLGRRSNEQRFRVTALFNSGMYEYDLNMVFISLSEAQDFMGIQNKINNIEIKVKNPYKSEIISENLKKLLGGGYWIQDWKASNRSLLEALELEKVAMFIILTMIVMVGALNIISTLVMIVMEKTRDVAILRSMGAARNSIMSIFVFQGVFVGFIGTLAGLFSGLGICYLLSKYKIIELPSDIYYMSELPVRVETLDVLIVVFASLLISFLATIYPSWHASRLNPVEALRYE